MESVSLECCARLKPLMDLAAVCGWWWPFRNVCITTPRPSRLCRDDEFRLHSDAEPAIAWGNAWGIYAIHGVTVPGNVVLSPGTQTIAEIDGDANEERRRVRIERFGWLRYLSESGAKARDRRRNDRDAQDEQLFTLADGRQRFVCVDPSTGRKYALSVPREVETCEQAQRFLSHGLDQYASHRS